MSTGYRIREVRPTDRDPIVQGYLALYHERESNPTLGIVLARTPPPVEAENAWFDALLESVRVGRKVVRVAEVDGRAVGLCEVTQKGSETNADEAHVGELGLLVHERHRGQGIGEALLREVLARCAGRFEIVVLSVFGNNTPAKRLYAKVGFRSCGSLPRGIKRSGFYTDSDRMFLELVPPDAHSRAAAS